MSDFLDEVEAQDTSATPPPHYRQHATYDDRAGEGSTGPIREIVRDKDQLLRLAGLDPETWRIIGRISQWTKTFHQKPDTYSFFFQFEAILPPEDAIDLPALYAVSRRKPPKPLTPASSGRTSVPVLADPQIGKVGSRGGTPELLDRMAEKRDKLTAELRKRKPERLVLADINDLFENFESGGNPMFTNDLSLSQQMDVAATEVYKLVELTCRFGPTEIIICPSNHTGWRRGSVNLGRPGDDLGIFVHRQVEKVAHAAGLPATWVYPEMYNESVVLDVRGTRLGVVHGNQFNPGKAPEWWAKQTHGGQPVATADILLTGHYHHLSILPTGRNPYSGKAKWWLQAPTLDNGSDWFRNIAGDDSDPGMLLFDITDDGFDLQSLTVL